MPWNVLALTFTNKAANEMKTRLSGMSSGAWFSGDVWCGTFHSICLRILRANHMAAGLQQNFLIYGEEDQKSVIKSLITSSTKQPADYVEEFSRIKDHGLIAYQSKDKLFNAYNAELARLNAVDFGDIILRVLKMFNEHPDILARYQNQFKYILVDEFQDTNSAQMELLCMLTSGVEKPNICCVGDDDQSIYSWRGAEIKHILDFQKTYPGAQIIRLETNYRSTSNILGAANSLIRHNRDRLGKELHNVSEMGAGEPVYVLTLPSDYDEVRIIADFIQRDETPDFSKFAVLIRTGSLSRLFEEEFGRRQIPYKLVGATKFYDRVEIRDVIAYLRLLAYPFDDMSFLRIIGKPSRQIGPKAIVFKTGDEPTEVSTKYDKLQTVNNLKVTYDENTKKINISWSKLNTPTGNESFGEFGYNVYYQDVLLDFTTENSYSIEASSNISGTYKVVTTFKNYNGNQSDPATYNFVYVDPNATPVPTPTPAPTPTLTPTPTSTPIPTPSPTTTP